MALRVGTGAQDSSRNEDHGTIEPTVSPLLVKEMTKWGRVRERKRHQAGMIHSTRNTSSLPSMSPKVWYKRAIFDHMVAIHDPNPSRTFSATDGSPCWST
jgi:hypothetical protein